MAALPGNDVVISRIGDDGRRLPRNDIRSNYRVYHQLQVEPLIIFSHQSKVNFVGSAKRKTPDSSPRKKVHEPSARSSFLEFSRDTVTCPFSSS